MYVSINTAVFLDELQAGISQLTCLHRLTDYSLDAIEVRGEFFNTATKNAELQSIDHLCQQQNWQFYYSVPEELFQTDKINPKLTNYLNMAARNHIKSLKFSLGDTKQLTTEIIDNLKKQLLATAVQVSIENQPNQFGTLANVTQNLTKLATTKLGYTFDAGNWCWVDTPPLTAFSDLKAMVTVFHLKKIQQHDTILLTPEDVAWQQILAQLAPTVPVFLEYAIPADQLATQIKLVDQQLQQRQATL